MMTRLLDQESLQDDYQTAGIRRACRMMTRQLDQAVLQDDEQTDGSGRAYRMMTRQSWIRRVCRMMINSWINGS